MKNGGKMNIEVKDNSLQFGAMSLTPEEAQEFAWQLLEISHQVKAHEKAKSMPHYESLEKYLDANPPTGNFEPHAWFNVDGNQLQIYWENEPDYGKEVENHSMCLHYGLDNEKVVGLTLYNIKKIMTDG
jgi:hypothetical protein